MSTTHPSRKSGNSQCDKILATLKACRGHWVAMPVLVAASGSYVIHSRAADLRKRGYKIDQRNERRNGQIHSFYKLQK